jgi:MoaA/NifB/PqqE/SkfB family radical SAM enzyme
MSAGPMQTRTVVTHRRCNQACGHCVARAPTDDPTFAATRAVLVRITEALEGGPAEIVLTGGEPTMRKDLPSLVRAVRAGGARAVLETNGTLIDASAARALKDAGLSVARIGLSRADATLDTITRDPGGFDRAMAGLAALLGEGLDVEVAIAITAQTIDGLEAVPAHVARAAAGTSARVSLLAQYVLESPDATLVVDHARVGRALASLARAAEDAGLPIRLAPDAQVPPCVLPREVRGTRAGHGLAISATRGASTRAAHRHLEACASCDVQDRCPGVSERYLARFAAPALEPIRGERAKRRLTLAAPLPQQIESELVQPSRARGPSGEAIRDAIVRVVFHCNQACRFCFVSTHLPEAGAERVERAIREAAARGERIVLSGGEPTLSPDLLSHVRLSRALSREHVTLQTNAVRCADRSFAKALREAGLDEATVSLHGATAATSDAITEAPGTFDKTLLGIDALRDAGVLVTLNFVICGRNAHELPAYVELVAARWPGVPVNVSFVAASTDVVPRDAETIPRYSDVAPHLAAAMSRAEALGVKVHGFEAMCGMPLCVAPVDPRRYLADTPIPEGFDGGEFVRTEACEGCLVRSVCWGLRKGYAALHGTSELRRVT